MAYTRIMKKTKTHNFDDLMAHYEAERLHRLACWHLRFAPWLKNDFYHSLPPAFRSQWEKRVAFLPLSYRKTYYLKRPYILIREIYWEWRNFASRGFFGYAREDCHWLDGYLAKIIPHMLAIIRDNRYSINAHCLEAACKQLNLKLDDVYGKLPPEVDKLAVKIEGELYASFIQAFQDYYSIMHDYHLRTFEEEKAQLAQVKEVMHKFIDYFEFLNT